MNFIYESSDSEHDYTVAIKGLKSKEPQIEDRCEALVDPSGENRNGLWLHKRVEKGWLSESGEWKAGMSANVLWFIMLLAGTLSWAVSLYGIFLR